MVPLESLLSDLDDPKFCEIGFSWLVPDFSTAEKIAGTCNLISIAETFAFHAPMTGV
jgi:hypothetical protein